MSERKINLEEILQDCWITTLDNSKEVHAPTEYVKLAMIEFGKQLLELAAENAELYCEDKSVNIKYTTNFEKNGNLVISIDRKSILDTINQVE